MSTYHAHAGRRDDGDHVLAALRVHRGANDCLYGGGWHMSGRGDALRSMAWQRIRIYVLERDRYRCKIRGAHCKGDATEVDHIVPRADGGALFDPDNLRAACKPCNGGRGAERTNRKYRTSVPTYETRF
jgi:HNH endonuclease